MEGSLADVAGGGAAAAAAGGDRPEITVPSSLIPAEYHVTETVLVYPDGVPAADVEFRDGRFVVRRFPTSHPNARREIEYLQVRELPCVGVWSGSCGAEAAIEALSSITPRALAGVCGGGAVVDSAH